MNNNNGMCIKNQNSCYGNIMKQEMEKSSRRFGISASFSFFLCTKLLFEGST